MSHAMDDFVKRDMEGFMGRVPTAGDIDRFVDQLGETTALRCLDGVCLHGPTNRICVRDLECPNFAHRDNPTDLEEIDFVRCIDCDALIMLGIDCATELIPHSARCWPSRNRRTSDAWLDLMADRWKVRYYQMRDSLLDELESQLDELESQPNDPFGDTDV